jgi:hypothetical protein
VREVDNPNTSSALVILLLRMGAGVPAPGAVANSGPVLREDLVERIGTFRRQGLRRLVFVAFQHVERGLLASEDVKSRQPFLGALRSDGNTLFSSCVKSITRMRSSARDNATLLHSSGVVGRKSAAHSAMVPQFEKPAEYASLIRPTLLGSL